MKLSTRISLLVISLVMLSGVLFTSFYDQLIYKALSESKKNWVETLDSGLSELLSISVINNQPLQVTEILSRLVDHQPSLEYAYVIGFDDKLFAHTFTNGLPRAFTELDHALHSHDSSSTSFDDIRRGHIQDFSVPLIEGMNAHLHLGINDTVLTGIRSQSQWQLALVITAVSVLGVVIVVPAARRISQPLVHLVSVVNDYAEGKKVEFEHFPKADPEIQTLQTAMRGMMADRDQVMEELAQREQYLDLTLDSISDGVIATDTEGRVTRINIVACKLTGWSAVEAKGRLLQEIFNIVNANSRVSVANPVEKVLADGKIFGLAKHTVLISKDGTEYQIADSGAPIMDKSDTILGVILVFRDISSEYQLQEELRQSHDRLEEAVIIRTKELESFSYSVSHDLRAPLRSINGFSRVLIEDYADQLDVEAKDYLQRIHVASINMGRLIDGLLQLSKINRNEITFGNVNLSELANNIIQRLSESESQRNVMVNIAADLQAQGDPVLLMVLLENLLGNAWKYTAQTKEPKIEFFATEIDGKNTYVVKDNGVGFDMQYADKLFGAFQRLVGSEYDGLGIGLATVQRIIRRHRGKVWAEAESGKGASFFFTVGGF